MKNTLKLFSIIAMLAVIAFSMTACNEDPGNDGVSKSLVITGITTEDTTLTVGIAEVSKKGKSDLLAYGQVVPPFTNSVKIPLTSYKKGAGEPYTGTGLYFIILVFEGPTADSEDDITYTYTGSTNSTTPAKYDIQDATTTLPFDEFHKIK
jgi:hypothetical protein